MEAIHLELKWHLDTQQHQLVKSVYFGGGTPSVVDSKYFEVFIQTLDK